MCRFASRVVVMSAALFIFFFKQKTAYEMRISDWSSDVCSSDLAAYLASPSASKSAVGVAKSKSLPWPSQSPFQPGFQPSTSTPRMLLAAAKSMYFFTCSVVAPCLGPVAQLHSPLIMFHHTPLNLRSEEHPSALQSLMRISYAVF